MSESYTNKKLDKNQALKLVKKTISKSYSLIITGHAKARFHQRGLSEIDVRNAFKASNARIIKIEPEYEKWKYSLSTTSIVVVFNFTETADGFIIISVFEARRI